MVTGDLAKRHPAPEGRNEEESKMMADVREWVETTGEVAALDVQKEKLLSKRANSRKGVGQVGVFGVYVGIAS
jgi:hypothetical protein